MAEEPDAAPAALSEQAAAFVSSHSENCEVTETGKVRFLLTGMEFPASATPELLQNYLSGKALRRAALTARNTAYDFAAHEPYVVPHSVRDKGKFMWCRLTERTLPRDCDVVRKHVEGRRFQAALKKAEERKAEEERIRKKRAEKAEKRKAWNEAHKGGKGGEDEGERNDAEMKGDDGQGEESDDGDAEMASAGSGDDGEDEDEDEVEGKDGEVFWTRGRDSKAEARAKGAAKAKRRAAAAGTGSDEDSDDDEWGPLPTKAAANGGATTAKGKKKAAANGDAAANMGKKKAAAESKRARRKPVKGKGGDSGGEDKTRAAAAKGDIGAKRKRDKGVVPKKSRRPTARIRQSAAAAL